MIARAVGVGTSTVYRTKQRFVEDGLDRALTEMSRPGAPRKLGASDEALLVAVACSRPPSGRARWTLDLLAGEVVRLTTHETVSGDTVGRRLAEMKLKPWQEKMWCIPHVNAEYVAPMADVLDLYAEAPDPRRPVVGWVDYEYVRKRHRERFRVCRREPPLATRQGQRPTDVCRLRGVLRDLVDTHYPEAERIRVVLDSLSAHSAAVLYQALPPAESRRILSRLEFHFTPNTPAGSTWSKSRSA